MYQSSQKWLPAFNLPLKNYYYLCHIAMSHQILPEGTKALYTDALSSKIFQNKLSK